LRIDGPDWQADVQWRQADLVRDLHALPFEGTQLVTASALLDLVSATWLDALIGRARIANAAMLFALTVDGRMAWQPNGDAQGHAVEALFAAHQRRDKGFGPAMGVEAAPVAAKRLAALGYTVKQAPSDWHIDASCPAMLRAMIDGLAGAALEQASTQRDAIESWRALRLAQTAQTKLTVGHVDLLAWHGPGPLR
jgi:hypothetical protein